MNWTRVGLCSAGLYALTFIEGLAYSTTMSFLLTTRGAVPGWLPTTLIWAFLICNGIFFAVLAFARVLQTPIQTWLVVGVVGLFGLITNRILVGTSVSGSLRDMAWALFIASIGFLVGRT